MSTKYLSFSAGIVMAGMLTLFPGSPARGELRAGPQFGAPGNRQTLIDADWLFHRGDVSSREQVVAAGYDDSAWQTVQLPHDYVLDGKYAYSDDKDVRNHAYLPLEVAWYRKHLVIPASAQGKILRLDFDGIFRDSEVWLNGEYLGRHQSGYTPISYDITKFARLGETNIVTVRVDPRQSEGHWYEGGGIYRHVRLTALNPLHVAQWGTYVASVVPDGDQGADKEADVTVQTTLENNNSTPANFKVRMGIFAPNGVLEQSLEISGVVPANSRQDVTNQTVLPHPKIWSLESPGIYELRTVVSQNGKDVDGTTTTFGIRTIRFDADKGFFLNGKHVEIQGAANHQDFPAVGIGMPDSLQPWRVAQLKKLGVNGWRTAHNMPCDALLDACDRMGMLVMEENRHLGDAYTSHTPAGSTATNLYDLSAMIQRDRNHPSVIMWSLCNEEGLRNKPEGIRMFAAMKDVVHRYDHTRPITCAINGSWLSKGIADEDLIGVNYHFKEYDAFHQASPHLPMFGSETTNEKSTRGQYAGDRTNGWVSSYNLSNDKWLAIINRPYLAGCYTWTGFDYKGEPNPDGWPDVSNNTGLLDCCGFPKDKGYYFKSCWSREPMVHLLPANWNWHGKEGQNIRVIAFSNGEKVELFLNGRSLGAQDMPHDDILEWQVPYAPGTLLAKAYDKAGKVVATDVEETTGQAAQIRLTKDAMTLRGDNQDVAVVQVSVLDEKGRVIPDANNRVSFKLEGPGRILGVSNGNPADHDPDRASERNAFNGHCMVLIQAGTQAGTLKLTASSPGLKSDEQTFQVGFRSGLGSVSL